MAKNTVRTQDTYNNDKDRDSNSGPYWLSKNPSKRWAEIFFLVYSVYWISVFGAVVVLKLYEVLKKLI